MQRRYALRKIGTLALFALSSRALFADNSVKRVVVRYNAKLWDSVLAVAKKEKKKIMLLFSGIEWCPPCKKFDADVLKDNQFKSFAKDNLVFVDVDRKRNDSFEISANGKKLKIKQSDVEEIARSLSSKYPTSGVPTAFILDADGKVLFQHVGSGITAKAFIEKIKALPDAPEEKAAEKETTKAKK